MTTTKTTSAPRKTAKYYRDILNGTDIYKSLSVIPEIIKKFGFVDKYRSEINFPRDVVHNNFNWNHSIEGFDLTKKGELYAKVYWQVTPPMELNMSSLVILLVVIPSKQSGTMLVALGEWSANILPLTLMRMKFVRR